MNKKVSFYLFIFYILFLFSCRHEEHPGYSETKSGLFYKLHSFSDGVKKPGANNWVEVQLAYMTERDSVFYDSRNISSDKGVYIHVGEVSFAGNFEEGIAMMSIGDSMTFLVNSDSFFLKFIKAPRPYFFKKEDMVKVAAKTIGAYSLDEYSNRMAEMQKNQGDRDLEEFKELYKYIKTYYNDAKQDKNGLYHIVMKEGNGAVAHAGSEVVVKLKGSFLNGFVFDRSQEENPYEFTIGEDGQAIQGIVLGIQGIKEGGKSKIIIPSHLGYGPEGSSTGIVPPFKTLVYEIELIKVK